MAPLGGPKLFHLLVVLLAALHSVNSGCGWSRRRQSDYDDDEDRYEGIDRDDDDDDDGGERRPYRGRSGYEGIDRDDDDDDDGGERRPYRGRSVSGTYDDRDDHDRSNSAEDDEAYEDEDEDDEYRYGMGHKKTRKNRKYDETDDHREMGLKPSERCHKYGGYCMRIHDRCKGEIRLFQTNCIDECECCMDGKEQVAGGNIEIVKRRRDWHGAKDECRDMGGDLLVPKSVGELLYQLRKNDMGTHKLWIGISDTNTRNPGMFRGIQGNRIKAGWQNREPRRYEVGDDCVAVQHRSDSTRGGMRVRRCREEHYFICDLSSNYRSDHTVRY